MCPAGRQDIKKGIQFDNIATQQADLRDESPSKMKENHPKKPPKPSHEPRTPDDKSHSSEYALQKASSFFRNSTALNLT